MGFGLVEIVILGILTLALCGLLGIKPSIKQHGRPALEALGPQTHQGVSHSTVFDDSKNTSSSPSKTAAPQDQASCMGPEAVESGMPRINTLSASPAYTNVPEAPPNFDCNNLTHEDYTIGWMCALPIELTVATAMLEQIHPDLPKANAADSNTYTLGRIGSHNVALAGLPSGSYGTNSAAVAASHMLSAFPNLRFGLMVGIGGGAPSEDHDIRLGDIVVSNPQGTDGGVIQIDLGKTTGTGLHRTGALNRPPTALLTALTKLEAEHFGGSEKVPVYVERLRKKYPSKQKDFAYRLSDDILYQADYEHKPAEKTCRNCDTKEAVRRENRESENPIIHYGTIASSNQVIKHGSARDRLQKEHGVLCFEMEAAGLMNDFPCIVIRGICDYADSHKNKRWQPYAAAVAAAYAREFLEQIPANAVHSTRLAKEITRTVTSAIAHSLRPFLDDHEQKERNKILDWLSQSNHEAKYADSISSDRYENGTGRWFLDYPEFETWFRKPGQTLFCPGIPGAGKTIIASLAIQNLLPSLSENKSIIAFLYCDYGRRDEQTTDGLLAALLRQFSQDDHQLPNPISNLHTICEKEKRRPKRDEVSRTLTAVVKSYDRVFIIIDALDECSEQTRRELLFSVRHLQKETSINLLATSRPVPEIEGLFQKDPRLEIRASKNDVEIYLQNRLYDLPYWAREDENLQQKIKRDISGAIDGMFLLARLHFDSLKGKQTQGEIEEALDAVQHPPKETDPLTIAYDGALQRIADQTPNEKMWAQRVISWVVLARRPLSPMELQHALGIRPGDRELNFKNFPCPISIVSLCAGLVLINQKSDVVQLVHYTTKEYFENNPPEWLQSAKTDLARLCLQYLTLDDLADGLFPMGSKVLTHIAIYDPFYYYAASYWGEHTQGVEANVEDFARTFLSNRKYTNPAGKAIHRRNSTGFPKWSGIHIVAFLGLSTWLQFLLDEQPDQMKRLKMVNLTDRDSRTPLYLAAKNGHEAVVKMLIDAEDRVTADSKNRYNMPLRIAAENGYEAVVKMLIDAEERVNADSKDRYDVPLRVAAENGHETVVKMLIDVEERVNADSKDRYDVPLRVAVEKRHETVVKMLIDADKRLNADSKDRYGLLLCIAAANGDSAMVKLFIDLKDRVDFNFKYYSTVRRPLIFTQLFGHEAVAKMITDDEDRLDAAEKVRRKLAKHIMNLRDKVDIDLKNNSGCTPLWQAVYYGREAVVKMLLDLGDRVDVNSKDDRGLTPLDCAIKEGHEAVEKILRDNGGC